MATTLVRTVLQMTAAGREAVNVLHFAPTSLIPLDLEELAVQVGLALDELMPNLSTEVNALGVQTSYTDGSGLYQHDINRDGEKTGQMLPPNCAYMIRHSIEGSSRGGRTFLPGVPASAVFNNGTIDTQPLLLLESGWQFFLDAVKSNVTEAPVLVIRRKNGTVGVVNGSAASGIIANQRRRLTD